MAQDDFRPLGGPTLLLACGVLALTNFMVVLDTTIANVSVPHIAGSLGISATQGTWIITSYSVAEAVCVPLTGWLAGRFGAVRTFIFGMIGFAMFSVLCGLSVSLPMIVAARIGQGLCGGPLMPLTQTLLLRVAPPEKRAQAMGAWAMTTVTAPILGPILGGGISDNWSWHWIFFINVPVALLCIVGAMRLLRRAETPTERLKVDKVGLALLVFWIGALQIMLDLGRERDWFGDPLIVVLGVLAAIGFAVFLAWESGERQPIVDLRVFRHRGFSIAVLCVALGFGTYFSSVVLIPQWLQVGLGYTATQAGYVTAFSGVGAVIMSPLVARMMGKVDPRGLVCFGIAWLGVTAFLRVGWTSGADFWTLAMPQMLQGIGMPFFFIAATTIALGAVDPAETASAAGVMSFLRTIAAAIGTSVSTTMYADQSIVARSEMVSRLQPEATATALQAQGFPMQQARGVIDRLVELEASTLAIDHVFLISALIFIGAASVIWAAPRPRRAVGPGAAH